MNQKGIDYEKFNLGEDYQREDFYAKFGQGSTFPQVHYKNENLGGMRETVRYLIENRMA